MWNDCARTSAPRAGAWCAALTLGAALVAAPVTARADSVTLTWTSTGDDLYTGRASGYELRYSDQPVASADTASWWSAASTAGVLPPPSNPGTRETYVMSGLATGTTYYFVLRVSDEVPNWSAYSNVCMRTAGGTGGGLATPESFRAHPLGQDVRLTWEEPASGAGNGYHLYRSSAGGPDSLLATLGVSTTAWDDTSVVGGVTYLYKLATYQDTAEGAPATASISVPIGPAAAGGGIHGYPNPASDKVTLRFTGGTKDGQPGHVRLAIYDLTGRLVSRLIDRVLPAGDQTFDWLCRSDAGNRVAPGLYNAILDAPQGRTITRIAVVP